MKTDRRAIELKDVIKRFNGAGKPAPGSSSPESLAALNGVTLSIDTGEFVIITGKSGSGKSTLLNMMTGIDSVTQGEVVVNGTPIHRLSGNQLAAWRGVNTGIVFQFFQLMPTLTVRENVMLPMEFASVIPAEDQRRRASMLLEKVDIAPLADKFPNSISGGEKQRVAIARALANDPALLFADEPTGNLDTVSAALIHDLFNNLSREGKTIVYVTHERDLPVAYSRIVRLHDGRIAEIAAG
jgi:putative ABC transport system ATP-binding protein